MKKIMFNDKYGLTTAVLEGRKTQTRRPMLLPNNKELRFVRDKNTQGITEVWLNDRMTYELPRYHVGEEIAVAQSYKEVCYSPSVQETIENELGMSVEDSAGHNNKMFVSAKLMPHRIKITNVRVERLQDISEDDCLKEGIKRKNERYLVENEKGVCFYTNDPILAFRCLIDKTCGKGTWNSNPWVFVYDFELIK